MTEEVEVIDNAIVFKLMVQNRDQREIMHIHYTGEGKSPGEYSFMSNAAGEITSHQPALKTVQMAAGENSQDATSGKVSENVLARLAKNLPSAS